jgi:hypothetical protein
MNDIIFFIHNYLTRKLTLHLFERCPAEIEAMTESITISLLVLSRPHVMMISYYLALYNHCCYSALSNIPTEPMVYSPLTVLN